MLLRNHMTPKLSIIIPCYNCEDTLREAVDSCYIQGFSNEEFEIIMVDDGSTDNTWKLMQGIASEYKNIKVLQHSRNRGGGATRNTAIKNSSADVLFCLDSDDILPPDTLGKMYTFLKEKNCNAVCIHRFINFNGKDTSDIAHTIEMFLDKCAYFCLTSCPIMR